MNIFNSNAGDYEIVSPNKRRLIAMGGAAAALTLGGNKAFAQEKTVTVYSTTHPAIQKALEADFSQRTGIAVRSIRLASGAMAQRFIAEQRAGTHNCDVITLGNPNFFDTIGKMGILEKLGHREEFKGMDAEWVPSEYYAMITAAPGAIAYNTKKVQGESLAGGWQDLLKPEFKNRMLMTDPRSNENFVLFLAMLKNTYGNDFLRALGKQNLRLVPVTQQGVEQVASGEADIIFPCLPGNLSAYKGKNIPVELTNIPDPTFWMPFFIGVTKNGPNKENAYRWLEYSFSPSAQEILCQGVSVSPLKDVKGALSYRRVKNPEFNASIAMSDAMFDLLQLPA